MRRDVRPVAALASAGIGIPMQEWAASAPPPIAVTYPGAHTARCVLVATTRALRMAT